jgi:hypothetical protein
MFERLKSIAIDCWVQIFLLFCLIGLVAFLIAVPGCMAIAPKSSPSLTPIQVVAQTQHTLGNVALFGWIVFALSLGAAIYGLVTADKLVEHIAALVAAGSGSVAGLCLAGEFVLPFLPWILLGIGVIGLGAAAYFVYSKYFAKPGQPAVPAVPSTPAAAK